MAKKGRPADFVKDANGLPILGLSYYKAENRYYVTFSKPRIWLGTDKNEALFRFRKWQNEQDKTKPQIELEIPRKRRPKPAGPMVGWDCISNDPPVISDTYEGETAYIPEELIVEKVREMILRDPIDAAKRFGISELARLDMLPRLEDPLYLKDVLKFYLTGRNLSHDETKKAKAYWKQFCRIIEVKSVREITLDIIHNYREVILKETICLNHLGHILENKNQI